MTEQTNPPEQIDYFADAPAPVVDLKAITTLAEEAAEKQVELDELSYKVQQLQQEVDAIYRRKLPELMKEAALEEFKLADGTKLALKSEIKAGITVAHQDAAFRWLEENEFDGIIKTKVTSEFGRGELEDAKKAVAALEAEGIIAEMNRSVHPATLKSFVKEQLEAGTAIPMDTFGVFEYEIVKATKPRVKK